MSYPSMDRLAELQQLIADFAKIKRVVPLANANDAENDVEHSYGLAMTCWFLHDKIASELDLRKILQYALAHDIVEIHAGDTYIFDDAALATKYQREKSALDEIEEDWKDFSALSKFAKGYMEKLNQEAKFVYAVDKILPVIMVELSLDQKDWVEYSITLEMYRDNKKKILESDIVAPYYEKMLTWLDERENIPKN